MEKECRRDLTRLRRSMILKHKVRGNSKTGFSSNCSPSFSAVYPASLGSRVIFGWLALKYLQAIGAVLGNFEATVVKAAPPMAIPPIARRYVLRMLKNVSVNMTGISALL
jgi:hypothetical protein